MKRKLIFAIFSLVMLGIAGFYYIDTIFLPIQLRQYITIKAEKYLRRKVYIGNIDFKLMQGFVMDDIAIARQDDPAKAFIKVKQVSFNLLLTPLYRKQAVIIPYIRVKDPFVYIAKTGQDTWNFSDLLHLDRRLGKRNYPVLILRKFELENGKVLFFDGSRKGGLLERFENINLASTLSLNKGIRFLGKVDVPGQKSAVRVKGNYSLLSRNLTAQLLLDHIYPARYLPLIRPSPASFDFTGGVLSSADFNIAYDRGSLQVRGAFAAAQADFLIGGTKRFQGGIHSPKIQITWRGDKWDAQGRLLAPGARLTATSGKSLQGDITADLNFLTISGNNFSTQGNVAIADARLEMGGEQYLTGQISAANASLSLQNEKIRLQGDLAARDASIVFNSLSSLTGDIDANSAQLTWDTPDGDGNRKLTVDGGLVLNNARAVLGGNTVISGQWRAHRAGVNYDRDVLTVEASGQAMDTVARFAENKVFTGSPDFTLFARYAPEEKVKMDFNGTVHFTNSSLSGPPFLDPVIKINGNMDVLPGRITTDSLSFHSGGAAFLLSGVLNNFNRPDLDVRVVSENVDLGNFLELVPQLKQKLQADITGSADVEAKYKGPASDPSGSEIYLTARLNGVTFSHAGITGGVSGMTGQLRYEDDLVSWKDLKAAFRGQTYTLNGRLSNFSKPVVDTRIISDNLTADTQIKILNQAFQVTKLTGNYFKSFFDLRGDVHLFEDSPADIDLRGKFTLDLSDIGSLVPRLQDKYRRLRPSGVIAGEGLFKGNFKEWRDWQLTVTGGATNISVKDFSLNNASFRFAQRDRNISKCDVTSAVYGGELTATCSSDLRDELIPFTAAVSLKNVDLALLQKDKQTKNKNLAGLVMLSAGVNGNAARWREMTGRGSLDISDGYLWKWDILEGISRILFIPEFQSLAFTKGHADFKIRDQRFYSDNADLAGEKAVFRGKGWLDFDGNLNFNVSPIFSKSAIAASESMKRGPTSILTQTDGYLNIKLTGTLQKPVYRLEKNPGKIIKETIGETGNTIKELIGGIVGEVLK